MKMRMNTAGSLFAMLVLAGATPALSGCQDVPQIPAGEGQIKLMAAAQRQDDATEGDDGGTTGTDDSTSSGDTSGSGTTSTGDTSTTGGTTGTSTCPASAPAPVPVPVVIIDPQTGLRLTGAEIEIRSVQIHAANGKWYRFQIDPFDLNLLELGAQFASVLGRATAPAGSYDQVRLITADEGRATFEDGSQRNLIVPSGTHTGIKIEFDPALQIVDGKLTLAGIVVDTLHSFVFPGCGGEIHFQPVIHVIEQTPIPLPTDDCTGGTTTDPGTGGTTTTDPGTGGTTTTTDPGTGGTTTTDPGTVTDPGTGSTDSGQVVPVDSGDTNPVNFPPVLGV